MSLHPFGEIGAKMRHRNGRILWAWDGHVVIAPVNPNVYELKFAAESCRDDGEQGSSNDDRIKD